MADKRGKSTGLFNRIRFKFWGRKAKPVEKTAQEKSEEEDVVDDLTRYTYKELSLATDGFSPSRIIGRGGSGVVYKGFLKHDSSGGGHPDPNGMVDAAVKMFVGESIHGERDYISEIRVINRLRHPNLVRLLGWCHEGEHFLLVHEFVPRGGLNSHLYRSELPPLSWEVRYWIAAGLASALSYLQNGWERCVVHRDIKPSNILLDANFNPKLTDFELARLTDGCDSELDVTNVIAGTNGYLAPEFIASGKFSKESDIYAFGVVLLELACGRRPVDSTQSRAARRNLLRWVGDLHGTGKVLEAADPRLGNAFNRKEMEKLLVLGHTCTCYEPQMRPSIKVISKIFNRLTPPFRNLIPEQESDHDSVAPDPAQQGMMPYFLSDVEDLTTVCFERTSTAAAEFAGGTSRQENIVSSATNGSSISELDNESATGEGSNSNLACEQNQQADLTGQTGQRGALSPTLENPRVELEADMDWWDIGIPANFASTTVSPLEDHHHPVINGFAASLLKLLQREDEPLQFDKVLNSIRVYTTCLVSVEAPLDEWNSLAQLVLRASKMMNSFPKLVDPRPTTAATLSSLLTYINECTRTIADHESRSENVQKQLSLARREYLSLRTRLAELEKQIEEAEEELGSIHQASAQHLELREKLSTILNQYRFAISQLSSFTGTM